MNKNECTYVDVFRLTKEKVWRVYYDPLLNQFILMNSFGLINEITMYFA